MKNDFDKTTGEYLGSKFTENHWGDVLTDCCGDSVLGWALWQEQVRISGVWPSMNPHPLHGVPFSDQHWCQPVMSMHKVHEKDMVDLWRWEWAHRDFKVYILITPSDTLHLILSHSALSYTVISHYPISTSPPCNDETTGTTPPGMASTHPPVHHMSLPTLANQHVTVMEAAFSGLITVGVALLYDRSASEMQRSRPRQSRRRMVNGRPKTSNSSPDGTPSLLRSGRMSGRARRFSG